MAFISIKAKLKFRGLVNVSGFHIDPGYRGKIIFAVFNAGPQPILLRRGQPATLTAETGAGKSTFVNALAGEERVIVSQIARTTRVVISSSQRPRRERPNGARPQARWAVLRESLI